MPTPTQAAILAHLTAASAAGHVVTHDSLKRAVPNRFVFAELAHLWCVDRVNVYGGVISLPSPSCRDGAEI